MEKRAKLFTKTAFVVLVIATVATSTILFYMFPGKPSGRAATNTWNQTNWIDGADTNNTANHLNDQTGWQKFYSKDANVDVATAGEVKLSATTSTLTETTTADFAAGTQSNTGASNNSVLLLKPEGANCSGNSECFYGVCATTCSAFVTIGTQLWMKYNVNVGTQLATGSTTPSNNGIVEKWCPAPNGTGGTADNLQYAENCATDGGLYQWSEMMGYAATCNGTGSGQPACSTPVQGICPSGTHIPSHYEWTLLEKNVGSNPGAFPYDTTTTGWLGTNEGTNLKSSGSPYFYGILAGYRNTSGTFNNRGTNAYFWSSTESGANAWYRYLNSSYATVSRGTSGKARGFSVRCLKD